MHDPHRLVGRGDHLHHAARARRADGEAIGVAGVEGVERVNLVVERGAFFRLETLVIRVLDDAEPLGHVNDVGRNSLTLSGQPRCRLVERAPDVFAARADERGRVDGRVRRRVVSHLLKRAVFLDRVLHEQRLKLPARLVRHADCRVDIVGPDGSELESLAERRLGEDFPILVQESRLGELEKVNPRVGGVLHGERNNVRGFGSFPLKHSPRRAEASLHRVQRRRLAPRRRLPFGESVTPTPPKKGTRCSAGARNTKSGRTEKNVFLLIDCRAFFCRLL